MGKDWYEGCIYSREWRLNHLYYIDTKVHGVQRFKLNWAQEQLLEGLWTRNSVLKARQLGVSTFIAILILDCCLFNSNFKAGIIDKTLDDAKEKMAKVALAFNCLREPPPDSEHDHVADEEDRKQIALFSRSILKTSDGEVTKESAHFDNGSYIRIGTSLRGGTLQLLHVSEFAYVARHNQLKAEEIVTGALNTVPKECVVIMESTHEGGKYGLNYEMTKRAMQNMGKQLTTLDYKFFFFPWWKDPGYSLPDSTNDTSELNDYWHELERQDIILNAAQKRWYKSQYDVYGALVKREYPSTPDEALANQVSGAIYGSIIERLRSQGKIGAEFEVDPVLPLYVSWDLGYNDSTAMWLMQPGSDGKIYVLDYYCNNKEGLEHYIRKAQEWEVKYEQFITKHLLPHDAGRTHPLEELSYEQYLQRAKFRTAVLNRVKDIWSGIFATREVLMNCVFHERCSRAIRVDTKVFYSGVDSLENYQTAPPGANGVERNEPLHDACSHGADAFRYFCEAMQAGLVSREGVKRREAMPQLFQRDANRSAGVPDWLANDKQKFRNDGRCLGVPDFL